MELEVESILRMKSEYSGYLHSYWWTVIAFGEHAVPVETTRLGICSKC